MYVRIYIYIYICYPRSVFPRDLAERGAIRADSFPLEFQGESRGPPVTTSNNEKYMGLETYEILETRACLSYF